MEKNNIALNVPKISKVIKEKHTRFIESVGLLPDKISSDKALEEERICAKIETILQCFKKEKVIDAVLVEELPTKIFTLVKHGFHERVGVVVDWKSIIFCDFTDNKLVSWLPKNIKVTIPDIDVDTYNWMNFVEKLIDYIHTVIYSRKEAIQTKIFKD